MDTGQFVKDIGTQTRTAFPLFRYLVLQTETHAFCLALACAALIGFYPFCVLLLSIMKQLHWQGGYDVILQTLRVFYPTSQDWLIQNLEYTQSLMRRRSQWSSIFWVFLGAAGVFVPLEAGLNRLWKVQQDRPYWQNQVVGVSLTMVCGVLAIAFVAINASTQAVIGWPADLLQRISHYFGVLKTVLDRIVLHVTAGCFFSIAIFLFYKFLPNRKIDTRRVLPAAVLAGIVAEIVKDVYVAVHPLLDIGNANGSQGPFFVSVSFVILAYFETFVVLGGAFLATQTETYPWMGFIQRKKMPQPPAVPVPAQTSTVTQPDE